MKKWKLMLGAVLAGLLMMAWTAHADSGIKVVIEGEEVKFDKSPVADSGTTLVPFRVLFEKLGLSVDWIGETKTIIGRGEGVTIQLQLDNKTAVINGVNVEMAVAPRIIDGSTYVPLRLVGESTGRLVNWDGTTRTITIGAAPFKGVDPETFYRNFVDANNAEDLEAVLAAIHPESPLLQGGLLEAEIVRTFETYDVVTEIEYLEVIDQDEREAMLDTVESNINTNDRFHMDNRMELMIILLKDDNGEWRIYNLEILGMEYVVTEDRLTADADTDEAVEKAILDVVRANLEASEAEDVQALLATIDPESPAYAQTENIISAVFLTFDFEYDLELINLVDATDTDAYVYTVVTTKKIDGPAFEDNRAYQVHYLKKQADGSWKVYISYTIDYEALR